MRNFFIHLSRAILITALVCAYLNSIGVVTYGEFFLALGLSVLITMAIAPYKKEDSFDEYSDGYDDGFVDGYDIGYEDGLNTSHQKSFDDGYKKGEYDGVKKGLQKGLELGKVVSDFNTMMEQALSKSDKPKPEVKVSSTKDIKETKPNTKKVKVVVTKNETKKTK